MPSLSVHIDDRCPHWLRAGLSAAGATLSADATAADVALVLPGQEDEPRPNPVVLWCSSAPCPDRSRWLLGPRREAEGGEFLRCQLRIAEQLVGHLRAHRRVLDSLANRQRELGMLASVARRLSGGYQSDELPTHVLREARTITGAEGGSLALVIERQGSKHLVFAYAENESISVPFTSFTLPLDTRSLMGFVAGSGETLHIDDAYAIPADAPYAFNREFDVKYGYRTVSLLVVPLVDRNRRTIAVLQLINKTRDTVTGARLAPQPFTPRDRELSESLASLATPVLESNRLYQQIEQIFDGLIHASVTAIETRDPTTSGHSVRVATGAVELARAVSDATDGPYAELKFSPAELRELRVAGLLHDFGKIGVPEHILTKAEKLYPWNWSLLSARYDTIRLAWRRREHEARARGDQAGVADAARRADEIPDIVLRLEQAKKPTLLSESAAGFLDELLARSITDPDLGTIPYLTPAEFSSLSIRRGSLTDPEREVIENHVVLTHRFLSRIPWTGPLERVPEYAHGHHEKLDGSGYPQRLSGERIPLQSRILGIVDFFDALAAWDRPYKPAVPVEKTLEILRQEAATYHFDAELVRLFIEKQCYTGMLAMIAKGLEKHRSQVRTAEVMVEAKKDG